MRSPLFHLRHKESHQPERKGESAENQRAANNDLAYSQLL